MSARSVTAAACALLALSAGRAAAQPAGRDEAASRQKSLKELDPRQMKIVTAFREKLPQGFTIRPGLEQHWSDDEKKRVVRLVSLMPVGPDGKPQGEARHYGNYGRIVRTVPYERGQKHGLEKSYTYKRQGRKTVKVLTAETPWKQGKIDGVKKLFYRAYGKIRMEIPFVKGLQHGLSKVYDLPGRLEKQIPYSKGKRHGKIIEFWPQTGKPKKIVPCRGDIVHGVVKEFHANGKLKREIPVRTDSFHGIEKSYDEDGKLVGTRYWIDDDRVTEEEYENQ